MNLTMRFPKAVALAAVLVMSAGHAMAAPISGSIGFSGTWKPVLADDTPTTFALAEKVDIIGNQAAVIGGSQSGDFAGIANFSPTAFNDVDFTTPNTPIDPLWGPLGAENFQFELVTVAEDITGPATLGLSGTGIMSGDGFDDTPFAWNFSGQETIGTLTFSTTNAAIPVPATFGMLGIALFGLGVALRRRRA